MGFEVFNREHGGGVQRIHTPTVTVGSRGSLTMSGPAYDAIDRPEYVELLYDREAYLIGIRAATNLATRYKVGITGGESSYSRRVMATAFCLEYGIDTEPGRRFPVKEVVDGILVVDLHGPFEKVFSPRAKR